jgi:hypothetical protein
MSSVFTKEVLNVGFAGRQETKIYLIVKYMDIFRHLLSAFLCDRSHCDETDELTKWTEI